MLAKAVGTGVVFAAIVIGIPALSGGGIDVGLIVSAVLVGVASAWIDYRRRREMDSRRQ